MIGTEETVIVLIQIMGLALAETEPMASTTAAPVTIDCCNDNVCVEELGRASYCGFQRRSDTLTCSERGFLEPRKKRFIEGIGDPNEEVPGGTCECALGHEIQDSTCQLIPVECCKNADCSARIGFFSFCGSRNFSETKTCPADAFPDLRRKREVEDGGSLTTNILPGLCQCREGYFLYYSTCLSISELKGCCLDDDCFRVFGNNSVCNNTEDKAMCFGDERRRREADWMGPSENPLVGECSCLSGYKLLGLICVPESQSGKCCSDEECETVLGPNSVCGEPSNMESQEDCLFAIRRKRNAKTILRPFSGECTCAPGFVLVNQSCVLEQLLCCSVDDCISKGMVNSSCRIGIGAEFDVCPDEKNPFTINPRKRREIGGNIEPGPSFQNADDVGLCTCINGFYRLNLTCIQFSDSRASTPKITTSPEITMGNSVNATDVTQTQGTPGASIGYRCYNFTCTGENCSESFLVETNFCVTFKLQCNVAKTCSIAGVSYIFGCADPCVDDMSPVSETCYSFYCDSETSQYCNNDTAVLDEFLCETSNGAMVFMNIFLLISVFVLYFI